ncbi:MAG: helix-turn-helix transcriptional regulator [Oscillospiraceae bacterium]|nr:helix-turn-helix transcriptional regulator [Oscillospiraceae bacterium]
MEFCDKLRSLRKGRRPRLTQEELAEKLNMTQRKISRMETGETEPSLEDIRTICRYFNVSADWLLGLEISVPEVLR